MDLSQRGAALTLKVDLLHNVLGLDTLLLVKDKDLSLVVLRPAILVHPNLHLCVWKKKQSNTVSLSQILLSPTDRGFHCFIGVLLCSESFQHVLYLRVLPQVQVN